ncbi:DUF1552 domain-containing protein [Pseudobacteriovorax antillogorgiicola]|uniref:Tat (Twin-arginine translocation) pathway signal sequence n=1 Tax=Pseudobacteriovorax antillogorgiicola TaxID=1513793 RepID=A0A1Y6BKL6_9BACT|nr:DUF1552 domain-containing protein [Pseudobacteriovorax antillogorgiicola]TCS54691.1 uncharacterized protein DUF1552 [Pseudobacteriovorax antillogorgiicola]SMF16462.1 Protein of unknown function [Pseudobacteriovorax antillogorgiicola]
MISRRKIIKNVSASALLYPLAGVFNETQAFGQEGQQKRALCLYYPDGSIANSFFPQSMDKFPVITAPLQPFAADISFIKGLSYQTSGSHEGGARFCFTGTNNAAERYSLDTFLGDRLGGNPAVKCLRLGVASGFQNGVDKGISYLQSSAGAVIEDHPKKAFYGIFTGGMDPGDQDKATSADRSILDFSLSQLKKLNTRLGNIEKEKLDNHLTALRELERQIDQQGNISCSPTFDSRGIDFPDRETSWPPTHQINDHFGKISEMMIDIMVEALHCGVTNSGFLQWSHPVSPTQFNFAGGPDISRGHHDMSHYGGDENGAIAEQFKKAQRWHKEQMAKLFTKLKARKVGDKSLFDTIAILATTELGDSNLHDFKDIPCFIAGGAGGALRQGQLLQKQTSYNQLLTTMVQAMGINQDHFGDPQLGRGAIEELLA